MNALNLKPPNTHLVFSPIVYTPDTSSLAGVPACSPSFHSTLASGILHSLSDLASLGIVYLVPQRKLVATAGTLPAAYLQKLTFTSPAIRLIVCVFSGHAAVDCGRLGGCGHWSEGSAGAISLKAYLGSVTSCHV